MTEYKELNKMEELDKVTYVELIPEELTQMRVYRHPASYKGARKDEFYYTATNSKGINMILNFKYAELPEEISSENVFVIAKVRGGKSYKTVLKDGVEYANTTIYVRSALVSKVPIEDIEL